MAVVITATATTTDIISYVVSEQLTEQPVIHPPVWSPRGGLNWPLHNPDHLERSCPEPEIRQAIHFLAGQEIFHLGIAESKS